MLGGIQLEAYCLDNRHLGIVGMVGYYVCQPPTLEFFQETNMQSHPMTTRS